MKTYLKWLCIFTMAFPFLNKMAIAERGYPAFGGEWAVLILAPILIAVFKDLFDEIKK